MVTWFGIFVPQNPDQIVWSWIDPGAMALIGAASFFGGVSRLTMSLTVIMVKISTYHYFLKHFFVVKIKILKECLQFFKLKVCVESKLRKVFQNSFVYSLILI